MKYPHPWLARVAWLVAVLGLLELLAGLVVTALPAATGTRWYGGRLLAAVHAANTAGDVWRILYTQAEDGVAVAVGPAVALLGAAVLRLAATDRLRLVRPRGVVRLARWPAGAGLGLAVMAVGLGAARWAAPEAYETSYGIAARVRMGLEMGSPAMVDLDHLPGRTSWSAGGGGGRGPATTSFEPARRLAFILGYEAYRLCGNVRPGIVLFCLCGVVYCLGRPEPDTAT